MEQGQSAGRLSDDDQKVLDRWLACVEEIYPKRLTKTYFLPPFFFRGIRYNVCNVNGENVLVHMPPRKEGEKRKPKSDRSKITQVKEQTAPVAGRVFTSPLRLSLEYNNDKFKADIATEIVLSCLRILSGDDQQGEVMMVISQLRFRSYLDNKTDVLHAAENEPVIKKLPSIARDSQTDEQEPREELPLRGDCDVLITHRDYGLITIEVKALGADMKHISDRNTVVKKMKDAVRQLNKAENFFKRVVSDIGPVNVTKTIILPHIKSRQLTEALETDDELKQVRSFSLISHKGLHDSQTCANTTTPAVVMSPTECRGVGRLIALREMSE